MNIELFFVFNVWLLGVCIGLFRMNIELFSVDRELR